MTTQTLTLTDFLLARIAEDEALARRTRPGRSEGDQRLTSMIPRQRLLFMRNGPRRLLAECESKRRIVKRHSAWYPFGLDDEPCCAICMVPASPEERDKGYAQVYVAAPCGTITDLAIPYAEHPDYREEWRP